MKVVLRHSIRLMRGGPGSRQSLKYINEKGGVMNPRGEERPVGVSAKRGEEVKDVIVAWQRKETDEA